MKTFSFSLHIPQFSTPICFLSPCFPSHSPTLSSNHSTVSIFQSSKKSARNWPLLLLSSHFFTISLSLKANQNILSKHQLASHPPSPFPASQMPQYRRYIGTIIVHDDMNDLRSPSTPQPLSSPDILEQ